MKYMLLIYHNEQEWAAHTEPERQEIYGEYRRFREETTASGHYLDGSQLASTGSATSVRVRDGRRSTTDGPFAETKEQLAGYFVIEAANLDVAIELAARIPSVRSGTVEVRPLV